MPDFCVVGALNGRRSDIDNSQAQLAQQQLNTLDAKVQALEVKVDKIIAHFGIK